jgi:hypothetical protein
MSPHPTYTVVLDSQRQYHQVARGLGGLTAVTIVTSKPSSRRVRALHSPTGPAPTMTTRWGMCGPIAARRVSPALDFGVSL